MISPPGSTTDKARVTRLTSEVALAQWARSGLEVPVQGENPDCIAARTMAITDTPLWRQRRSTILAPFNDRLLLA
jgi:hypothetical protein